MIENSNQEITDAQSSDAVDDYGQYHIENPFEMCSILKSLITKPDVITAYYDESMKNFILTSVISVDTKKRNFIMDISSDLKRNEQFVKSTRVICKTKCNNVQVEFSVKELKPIKYNNEDAFLCNLPQNILYLQRRDFYRMDIPVGDKLICRVSGNGKNSMILNLADISSGGVGVNESDLSKSFTLFELYHHCEIDLGETGTITFDLELRNKRTIRSKKNTEILRLGYKFVDLQTPDNAKIQRYIHSVDMRKKQSK